MVAEIVSLLSYSVFNDLRSPIRAAPSFTILTQALHHLQHFQLLCSQAVMPPRATPHIFIPTCRSRPFTES
jgi:hypothetical protein